jgi:hypothetical protein
MGEPLRSPQIALSSQQLQEGSIYLGQVFLGLAALAQIRSEDLVAAMSILQSAELAPANPQADSLADSQASYPKFGMDAGMNINGINSSSINLDFSRLSDRLLSQNHSNSLVNSLVNSPGNSLTFPELTFAIRVLSHLCQQHRELIRRAVSLMEQITQEGQDPWQVTLLKDYSKRSIAYSSLHLPPHLSEAESNQWRGKILLDLLFYSSPYGQERLWLRCTQPVNISNT